MLAAKENSVEPDQILCFTASVILVYTVHSFQLE